MHGDGERGIVGWKIEGLDGFQIIVIIGEMQAFVISIKASVVRNVRLFQLHGENKGAVVFGQSQGAPVTCVQDTIDNQAIDGVFPGITGKCGLRHGIG